MRSLRSASCWLSACLLVLTIAGVGNPIWAARKDDGDKPYWRTNLFKRVGTDQKYLLTRWFPREFKDPSFTAPFAVGLAMAIQSGVHATGGIDRNLESEIYAAASPRADSAATTLTAMGEGVVVASILGVTYLSARHVHNDQLSEASSLAAESLLDAGIWIVVLKSATARVRPPYPEAGRFFQYGASGADSFPSGHAMGAFSVASVFAEVYKGNKRWVPWLAYGIATAISASRLALDRHFPGDVIVGATLGASIGRGVVARNGEETPHPKGTFGPVVGPKGRGVGVGWRYSWK